MTVVMLLARELHFACRDEAERLVERPAFAGGAEGDAIELVGFGPLQDVLHQEARETATTMAGVDVDVCDVAPAPDAVAAGHRAGLTEQDASSADDVPLVEYEPARVSLLCEEVLEPGNGGAEDCFGFAVGDAAHVAEQEGALAGDGRDVAWFGGPYRVWVW